MNSRALRAALIAALIAAPAAAEKPADNAEARETEMTAGEVAGLGPAIGAPIPHDLSLTDAAGAPVDFAALKGEKGAAVFFVRSVDWCPFCIKQALDVNARADDFRALGLAPVLVSYDAPATQMKFAEKEGVEIALVSDEQSEAIKAFGLLNETHAEGSRFYGVPHPAVFIVDDEKVIRAKLYEEDYLSNKKSYRNRPAIDVILDEAKAALAGETVAAAQ